MRPHPSRRRRATGRYPRARARLMKPEEQARREARHHDSAPGTPEPSLIEMLPLICPGLTLDIAAGTGRNAIALARAGFRVVAADFSTTAMRILADAARSV